MRATILLVMAALGGTFVSAAAQTGMRFNLARQGNETTVTSATIKRRADTSPHSVDPAREQTIASGEPLVVNLACAAPVDCRGLGVSLLSGDEQTGGAAPTGTPAERTARLEFTPDLFDDRTNLRLRISAGDDEITTIGLAAAAASPERPGRGDAAQTGAGALLSEPLSVLRTYDCSPELRSEEANLGDGTYSRRDNLAILLMDANANTWSRPPVDSIDENDIVEVRLVAHPQLLPALKVRRTSAFRVPGALNIVGADAKVPALGQVKAGGEEEARLGCGTYSYRLGDFQPGRAEVTVSAITDKGDVPTGTVEFGVNTLYAGAFALGAIRTELRDPQFGLVWNGADSVITRTEDRTPRTLYTLTYTPFIWGKRDLEKRESMLDVRRLNPTFGIVLSDIQNNFVVGATYDLVSAVYLSAGVHLGHVRRLNPDAGYTVGEAFTGNRDQLPTTRDWRHDVFVGISLDLRAASQFIQKAIGSPSS